MRVPPILSQRPEAKERGITVHSLYFAQIREILGRPGEDLRVPNETTLKQVFTSLAQREPRLGEFADSLVFFLNEDRAGGEEILHDGDVIALCPPVSGG